MNHVWAYWGLQQGFYAKQGLTVQTVDNVADPVAALAGGQVQFVAQGVATHSGAVRGAPVKAVMVTFRDNLGMFGLPSINSIEDLKGKKIIGPNDIMKEILNRSGIDGEKGVTWITSQVNTQQQVQLVKNGQADALTGYPPARLLAERGGLHQIVVTSDKFPGVPVSIVGTTDKMIQSSPDVVKQFLAATLDTMDDMKKNHDAMVDYFMKKWGFDQELAEGSYKTVTSDLIENGLVPDAPLQVTLEVTKKAQGNTENIPLSRVWDFTLLKQVLAQRGKA